MDDNSKTLLKGSLGMIATQFSEMTLEDIDSILSISSTVGIFLVTAYKILKNRKNGNNT